MNLKGVLFNERLKNINENLCGFLKEQSLCTPCTLTSFLGRIKINDIIRDCMYSQLCQQ